MVKVMNAVARTLYKYPRHFFRCYDDSISTREGLLFNSRFGWSRSSLTLVPEPVPVLIIKQLHSILIYFRCMRASFLSPTIIAWLRQFVAAPDSAQRQIITAARHPPYFSDWLLAFNKYYWCQYSWKKLESIHTASTTDSPGGGAFGHATKTPRNHHTGTVWVRDIIHQIRPCHPNISTRSFHTL